MIWLVMSQRMNWKSTAMAHDFDPMVIHQEGVKEWAATHLFLQTNTPSRCSKHHHNFIPNTLLVFCFYLIQLVELFMKTFKWKVFRKSLGDSIRNQICIHNQVSIRISDFRVKSSFKFFGWEENKEEKKRSRSWIRIILSGFLD